MTLHQWKEVDLPAEDHWNTKQNDRVVKRTKDEPLPYTIRSRLNLKLVQKIGASVMTRLNSGFCNGAPPLIISREKLTGFT